MTGVEDTATLPTEADKVEAWRMKQLLDAGYPEHLASALAALPRIDLHQALDLVARGCDPKIAAEILL